MREVFPFGKVFMNIGEFYFISDEYYEKFKNLKLMENKEIIDGISSGRPCYYVFKDKNSDIYWMVPISSQVEKYEKEYQHSIKKYGICDGIIFGYFRGKKHAFLVQNMCPVTAVYIKNVYIDRSTNKPHTIPSKLKSTINANVRKAIRMYREKGKKIIQSGAFHIEEILLSEMNSSPKPLV